MFLTLEAGHRLTNKEYHTLRIQTFYGLVLCKLPLNSRLSSEAKFSRIRAHMA